MKMKIVRIEENAVTVNGALKLENDIANNLLLNLWNRKETKLKIGESIEVTAAEFANLMN